MVCVSKREHSLIPHPPPLPLLPSDSSLYCVSALQWGSHGGMYLPDYYWDQINAVPVDYLCSQWFLRPEWLQYMWVSHYPSNTSHYYDEEEVSSQKRVRPVEGETSVVTNKRYTHKARM